MRCFIAVDIDEPLRQKLAELQKGLAGFDVKLVEKENLHFTLKFLGEIDEQRLEEVKSRIRQLATGFSPFEIEIKGMGAFPSLNYIRVVWIGAKELFTLQKAVADSVEDLFGKEREVTPHLTIARIRSAQDKVELKKLVEKNRDMEIGRMAVSEIKLKKSTVMRSGPVYEDVEAFKLGG